MSDLAQWTPRPRPDRAPLDGRWVRLEPLDAARHGKALFAAHRGTDVETTFRYLPYGPFASDDAFRAHLERQAADPSDIYFALLTPGEGPCGVASLMSIVAEHGCAEVGHICLAPKLQRTAAATEMVVLIGRLLFDRLGYRRYEWKCDNANERSKAAALRFGFRPEGVFRNHRVVNGRNRDTAWFAITDEEWPARRAAFEAWLSPDNFDADGRQKAPLLRA